MARIVLTGNTLVQRSLLQLTNELIAVKQRADRLRAIADAITNDGAQRQNLETSPESAVPAGSGVSLYQGIVQINTALDTLSALVATIDQASAVDPRRV
jgi:hypothetical protein